MASFNVEIPDELLPAIVAEFSIVQGSVSAETPEEYFRSSVVEILRQRAKIYKVGPYYTGAVNPQFNQDGTPYAEMQSEAQAPVQDNIATEGEL